MELGETISHIRKSKNISIKNLCGDRLSRSAYTRFVNGETDTSATNFLYFLDRLHVTFNEFMFIKNNYHLSEEKLLLLNLQEYYLKNDLVKLNDLKKECLFLSKDSEDVYHHVYLLCSIYISRLNNYPIEKNIVNDLKKYLLSVDTWTHYEILLFNNSMFIFDIEFIELVINKSINSIEKYKTIRDYTNESFGMLLNVMNIYLSSKKIEKANKLFQVLTNLDLSENFVKERLFLLYYEGIIKMLIYNDSEGKELVVQSISCATFLNMTDTSEALNNMYTFIKNLYNIE